MNPADVIGRLCLGLVMLANGLIWLMWPDVCEFLAWRFG